MPVLLRHGTDLSAVGWESWLAVSGTDCGLDPARRLPDVAHRLEQCFDAVRDQWWAFGREAGPQPGAQLSHAVACGAYGSDFGLMLAWGRLVAEVAGQETTTLVVCDDPWLFRHLQGLAGVEAGSVPGLARAEWRLRLRGLAARTMLALRLAQAWRATRRWLGAHEPGQPILLVYGHPGSDAQGKDAYFGTLMRSLPPLGRMLHTDCPPQRAAELAADGRTASLHAHGNPLVLALLPFTRWAPGAYWRGHPLYWLVRRAAARENGGGGPAMNRWQIHCQGRWLGRLRPRAVAWPWENHAWERAFCRAARAAGVRTLGYQHTVIGRHQINFSPRGNWDGLASHPDRVMANGPAYGRQLRDWDVPADHILIGGAFRFDRLEGRRFDPAAPVFVPLSAIRPIAELQVEAARRLAAAGHEVLLKDHPMYPIPFEEGGGLTRTHVPLVEQAALAAVVYTTGTTGLEGLLLGVPTFRLLPFDRVALDILPDGIAARAVTIDQVVAAVAAMEPPPALAWDQVLSPPDTELWKRLMIDVMDPAPGH